MLVEQDNAEVVDYIYKELDGLIKKYAIESLQTSQPEKCFATAYLGEKSVHFRFAYSNGRSWASYYSLKDLPKNITDLITASKIVVRDIYGKYPREKISSQAALASAKPESIEEQISKINKYVFEHPSEAAAYNDRGMTYLLQWQ